MASRQELGFFGPPPPGEDMEIDANGDIVDTMQVDESEELLLDESRAVGGVSVEDIEEEEEDGQESSKLKRIFKFSSSTDENEFQENLEKLFLIMKTGSKEANAAGNSTASVTVTIKKLFHDFDVDGDFLKTHMDLDSHEGRRRKSSATKKSTSASGKKSKKAPVTSNDDDESNQVSISMGDLSQVHLLLNHLFKQLHVKFIR